VTVHRDKCFVIKATRCTNFSNLFWKETLHVSDSSSAHHQEFFTIHTAVVYVTKVFWQLASRIRMERSDAARKLSANRMTYAIAVFTVKNSWWWKEELSETCRISFQNKFEKLVHLGGFIYEKYFNTFTISYYFCTSITLTWFAHIFEKFSVIQNLRTVRYIIQPLAPVRMFQLPQYAFSTVKGRRVNLYLCWSWRRMRTEDVQLH